MAKILLACEISGVCREAFMALGHEAWSCDLLPSHSLYHIQGPVQDVLNHKWDLMIAFPPCTYLSASGLWRNNYGRGFSETEKALTFVELLMNAPIGRICIENPVGAIGSQIRPADQYIQPYEFGHDASKRTGLWLKGLPLLKPTGYVAPRIVNGKKRWANQTDSGQNRLGPSEDRAAIRAITYQGIANAMAQQWGSVLNLLNADTK